MSKGGETQERIIARAVGIASRDGLEGIRIGVLAAEMGLSKSGLFAHFGSKEELQLAVLQAAAARFAATVVRPALQAPRGEPRLRALFDRWLTWGSDPSLPGGCIFIAAAAELDDREGALRDRLVETQKEWLATLAKAARLTVEAKHFRDDVDGAQFAFELYAIGLGYHHASRLLRDRRAHARAHRAFERLLADCRR